MDLPADPGQMLTIPGSKSAEALRFLASWTSTSDQVPAIKVDQEA